MAHTQGYYISSFEEIDTLDSTPLYQLKNGLKSLYGTAYATATESQTDIPHDRQPGYYLHMGVR